MFTTHNSHYKIGYDGINDFRERENEKQHYTVEFGRAKRISTFKQEAINAAKQIYKDADGKTIYISYSGGVDSEFIIHTFLKAEVPFEVITARFKNDINAYDFHFAEKFCSKYSFKFNVIDIDIIKFLETKMMDYADAMKCCSPQFPLHYYIWDSVDGFVVAGHELVFRRNNRIPLFETVEKEDSVHRYHIWRNRDGAPAFYFYTPELVLSFMLEPEILKLFAYGKAFKMSYSGKQKTRLYEKCFGLEKRKQATGFELIDDIDKEYRKILEEKYLFPPKHICNIHLNDMIEQLCPKYFLKKGIIP